MKVLRVLYELMPSGVEVILRNTYDLWISEGMELEILAIGPTSGPYADELRQVGYTVHHIPLQPFGRFFFAYIKLIRDGEFDAVHIHPEKANFFTAGLARALNRRTLRSIHNVFPFEGALGVERRTQRFLLRAFGVEHMSVGSSVKESEMQYFANPTRRVWNCYDEDRFVSLDEHDRLVRRSQLGIREDQFVIITVGNCSEVKNHEALLRAMSTSSELGTSTQYLHIGSEEKSVGERALAHQLGLGSSVRFLGQIPNVEWYLQVADCFVMPSLYEGLGNAALEAVGCGLPCVLADVQGLRDLQGLIPGIVWIEPTVDGVMQGIGSVMRRSPAENAHNGVAAAQAVRETFSRRQHVTHTVRLYRGQ